MKRSRESGIGSKEKEVRKECDARKRMCDNMRKPNSRLQDFLNAEPPFPRVACTEDLLANKARYSFQKDLKKTFSPEVGKAFRYFFKRFFQNL